MFKTMRGFGDPLQYSVFLCVLSLSEKVVMLSRVKDVMNQKEDKFMLANIGPETGRGSEAFEFIGMPSPVSQRNCIIT